MRGAAVEQTSPVLEPSNKMLHLFDLEMSGKGMESQVGEAGGEGNLIL